MKHLKEKTWPTCCGGALFVLSAVASAGVVASEQIYDCVITPSAIVEVGTAEAGVLHSVNVERSDRVAKGQLLAQLDSGVEIIDRDLAKARANMDAVLKLRQVDLRFDDRSLKRVNSLQVNKLISAELKDKAEREAELARWRLQDAKDLLRQRQLELRRAEAVLIRRQVRSPIDGIIVQRLRHPGEYIEEQPILRIAQLDPLYVEVIMPMAEFGRVKPGMHGTVVSEIQPDQRLSAKVVVVDGIGDAASGTFGVRLALSNPKHDIAAGVKCRVQLQHEQVATEPRSGKSPALATDKKAPAAR